MHGNIIMNNLLLTFLVSMLVSSFSVFDSNVCILTVSVLSLYCSVACEVYAPNGRTGQHAACNMYLGC